MNEVQQQFVLAVLLFYFLPKLAIYLPLCWLAFCCRFTDPADAAKDNAHEQPTLSDREKSEEIPWYQTIVESGTSARMPNGWL